MLSKCTLDTGATGQTPPEKFRTTRSQAAKSNMQQANASPQEATLEKKKAKAKELELGAHKLLIDEECMMEENTVTHLTILNMLMLIIQKYSATAPQNLTKALTALAALLKQANTASSTATQLEMVVDMLSQQVGEHIEKTMHKEMEKMSTLIKVH